MKTARWRTFSVRELILLLIGYVVVIVGVVLMTTHLSLGGLLCAVGVVMSIGATASRNKRVNSRTE